MILEKCQICGENEALPDGACIDCGVDAMEFVLFAQLERREGKKIPRHVEEKAHRIAAWLEKMKP